MKREESANASPTSPRYDSFPTSPVSPQQPLCEPRSPWSENALGGRNETSREKLETLIEKDKLRDAQLNDMSDKVEAYLDVMEKHFNAEISRLEAELDNKKQAAKEFEKDMKDMKRQLSETRSQEGLSFHSRANSRANLQMRVDLKHTQELRRKDADIEALKKNLERLEEENGKLKEKDDIVSKLNVAKERVGFERNTGGSPRGQPEHEQLERKSLPATISEPHMSRLKPLWLHANRVSPKSGEASSSRPSTSQADPSSALQSGEPRATPRFSRLPTFSPRPGSSLPSGHGPSISGPRAPSRFGFQPATPSQPGKEARPDQ